MKFGMPEMGLSFHFVLRFMDLQVLRSLESLPVTQIWNLTNSLRRHSLYLNSHFYLKILHIFMAVLMTKFYYLKQALLMTEKIGFPDYIMDPVELDKDYEGVRDHFGFTYKNYFITFNSISITLQNFTIQISNVILSQSTVSVTCICCAK